MVRVNTEKQETQRQHDALDPLCVKVFVEKVSGKLAVNQHPGPKEAASHLRDGDRLTIQEVDRLGRNLLDGIATGEHTERNFVLDMPLALTEDGSAAPVGDI